MGCDPAEGAVSRRTAFIRKANPYLSTRRGRFFATLAQTLTRVERPVFAFDDRVDLIVSGETAAILTSLTERVQNGFRQQ